MRRAGLVAAGLAGLVALTACATGPATTPGPGGTDTTSGVTMTPSTTPEPATPSGPGATTPPPQVTATAPPSGREVTVTGTVVVSEIEMGCLMLEGYELFGGDPTVLQPGRRVRVTGVIATDLASICQQGPILRVSSAEPA